MAQQTPNKQLFDLLVSKGFEPQLLNAEGKPAANPAEAEVLSFDFQSTNGNDYGTVVCMFDTDGNVEIYFGDNVGSGMEPEDKDEWFDFLYQIRMLARRNLLSFSVKNLNRLKYSMQGQAALKESWNGTKNTSFNGKPDSVRLMIKHNKDIGEGEQRFRHINKLFVETSDGERFLLPFTRLSGGRAMTQHIRQGGKPYDLAGQHIIEMVNELNVLSHYRRTQRGKVLEGDQALIMDDVNAYYENLQQSLKGISTQRGYKSYFESWEPATITEQSAMIECLRTVLTNECADQSMDEILPVIAKATQEKTMKETQIFEQWAETLSEGTWTTPDTPEKQSTLVDLLSRELPCGADGTNATEQLYDLIGDDILFDHIQDLAAKDPDADCRPIVIARLQELQNIPDIKKVLDQINVEADTVLEPSDPGKGVEPAGEISEDADVSKMSTDQLQKIWNQHKDETGAGAVFASKLKKIAAELARRKKQGVNEGINEVDAILQDIARGDREVEDVMNRPTSPEEKYAAQELQRMYDETVIDTGLHADDDFEKIHDHMIDQLAKKYGIDECEMCEDANFGSLYSEQLAQKMFDQNPDFSTKGRADELISAAWPVAVKDLGKKRADWEFNYDEDFISDFVSSYAYLQGSAGEEVDEGYREIRPIDRERYTDLSDEGLEGPFNFNGRALYYDPREGKYYDRDRDMYLDAEEADDIHRMIGETAGVTDYNPKSQGGTRKELLAKYARSKSSADATAARKAGASQGELKAARETVKESADDLHAIKRLLNHNKPPKKLLQENDATTLAFPHTAEQVDGYRKVEELDGPYRYPNGTILYFNRKTGEYFDPEAERYLDPEEQQNLLVNMNDRPGEYENRGEEVEEESWNETRETPDYKESVIEDGYDETLAQILNRAGVNDEPRETPEYDQSVTEDETDGLADLTKIATPRLAELYSIMKYHAETGGRDNPRLIAAVKRGYEELRRRGENIPAPEFAVAECCDADAEVAVTVAAPQAELPATEIQDMKTYKLRELLKTIDPNTTNPAELELGDAVSRELWRRGDHSPNLDGTGYDDEMVTLTIPADQLARFRDLLSPQPETQVQEIAPSGWNSQADSRPESTDGITESPGTDILARLKRLSGQK